MMSNERFIRAKRRAILKATEQFRPYLKHTYRMFRAFGLSRKEALARGYELAATYVAIDVSKIRATSERA